MTVLPDGAIDFHVHAAPSLWERKFDAIELAKRASEAGLGGFVLKSHFWNTVPMVGLAAERVTDVDIYSSVALNTFVGGFNPSAAQLAIETGASVVWLPTFSAANFTPTRPFPFEGQQLTVFSNDGELRDDVRDVLEMLADADRRLVLGNGHLGPDETFAVFDELDQMGSDTPYLLTHPDSAFMCLSVADQVELADRGAHIEKCYLPVTKGDITVEGMADSIGEIGVDRCVLSTDFGQPTSPSPPDGFREFAERLVESGLSEEDIATMARDNPRSLLRDSLD